MRERAGVMRILTSHFFRRFFDNDTVQMEGETLITVVRAACVVAVPGLMFAFFLQNAYPRRGLWGRVEDEYFFILISFVAMGLMSIFEWEMLFPDRLDFLVLTPLPLRVWQLMAAKAAALIGFFIIFIFSSNVCGAGILPLLSRGLPFRQMAVHALAVLCAGAFAALFFLALGGVLLWVLGGTRFKAVSPVVQMLSVTGLVLLLMHYARYVDQLPVLLGDGSGMARWSPPFWFLGMYEWLLRGAGAPGFAREFTRYGMRGLATVSVAVVVTYPLAWVRMRKMAMEGSAHSRVAWSAVLAWMVRSILRKPEERAVFHFIGKTMARSHRYQVYLAMYGGTGLALAVACAVTFAEHGGRMLPVLSDKGLHAVMPLLLFWVIAGLRGAFAFPSNLAAGWVFRVAGVNMVACANAARQWALCCALGVAAGVFSILLTARWDWRLMLVQAGYAICLCMLLTDGLFFFYEGVPFTQPRMPGKTSLPLMLTLYVGVFPLFVYGVVYAEMRMEKDLLKLGLLVVASVLLHAGLAALRDGLGEVSEALEGYEGEFQVLGLS